MYNAREKIPFRSLIKYSLDHRIATFWGKTFVKYLLYSQSRKKRICSNSSQLISIVAFSTAYPTFETELLQLDWHSSLAIRAFPMYLHHWCKETKVWFAYRSLLIPCPSSRSTPRSFLAGWKIPQCTDDKITRSDFIVLIRLSVGG